MRARLTSVIATLALLASCSDGEPTRVVVSIDADPAVRAAASALRLRVIGSAEESDAGATLFDETRALAAIEWPVQTTIVPAGGDASRELRIEALVHDASGQMIAEVRAVTGFVAGETRVLRLRFDGACLRMLACNDLQTCVDGICASAVIAPRDLAPFGADAGDVDPFDAGVREPDGGGGGDACTPLTSYDDVDGDGWGDPATVTMSCAVPAERVTRAGDCDDACPTCNPEGVEICDGARDEDCDGTADEGCACTTGATRECPAGTSVGACEAGEQACVEGIWGPCTERVDPIPEDCDAIDDDCDGRTDEDLTRACGSGVGACGRGTETCAMGTWGRCTATMPRAETCNGADDDCDGRTDEGVTRTFYRDADGDGYGANLTTMTACTMPAGYVMRGGDCNDACRLCRPGGAETCDGTLDEDCDGTVDDGCGCTTGASRACPDGIDTGLCSAGTQTCAAGAWGMCTGRVLPTAEACNAQDDDCDARIDEGLVQGCGPATDTGVCQRGTQSCSAGAWGVCTGAVMPGAESCNGLDDDCDGSIDEGVCMPDAGPPPVDAGPPPVDAGPPPVDAGVTEDASASMDGD